MSWSRLDPDIQVIAVSVLTPAQLEAWKHELDGHGTRRISIFLDLSRSAVVDRLDGAYRALRRHGVTQDASGNWHLDRKDTAA